MTWLRNRVSHIPVGADAATLCQFPTFCPDGFNILRFSLSSRLAGLRQQTRDNHHDRGLRLRCRLHALRFDKIQRLFRSTPYDDPQLQQMTPDWIRSTEEICTWRPVFHHVDRVKRQLGGQQQQPEDQVNVDEFLFRTAQGDNVWWPKRYHL
ncbi:hypothetical protein AHAS_Ahas19G0142900 [Arachis hypogaea]